MLSSVVAVVGVGVILGGQRHARMPCRAMQQASSLMMAPPLCGDGAVLVSALCYAFSIVLVRRQALVAGPVEVAFSQSVIVTALMVGGEAVLWAFGGTGAMSWPDMRRTVLIATTAVLAVASLMLLVRAYARGEVSMLSTGEYTAFVRVAGLGWILFGERVSMVTRAGAWTPQARPASTILTVSSGLAFVSLAASPTYSATTAAIHSYSDSLRHQLRDTAIEFIEVAPPAVATDLMPGHAENPRSMPLDAYIAETMTNLKAHLKGPEDSVDHIPSCAAPSATAAAARSSTFSRPHIDHPQRAGSLGTRPDES